MKYDGIIKENQQNKLSNYFDTSKVNEKSFSVLSPRVSLQN